MGRQVKGLQVSTRTRTSLLPEWEEDNEEGPFRKLTTSPFHRESIGGSHNGGTTHPGVGRMFAHGESQKDIGLLALSTFCLCASLRRLSLITLSSWLMPVQPPKQGGELSSH